jgi:hypothetical protein
VVGAARPGARLVEASAGADQPCVVWGRATGGWQRNAQLSKAETSYKDMLFQHQVPAPSLPPTPCPKSPALRCFAKERVGE